MRNGPMFFASRDLSVVDDVADTLVARGDQDPDEIGQSHPAIDLGGGYIEINGYVFHEDWNEIDPPGSDDEPEIPHEEVMAYLHDLVKKRRQRREAK